MPYIDPQTRTELDPHINNLTDHLEFKYEGVAGEINYVITKILVQAWKAKPGYFTIALLIGTVICAVFEFYRRVAVPYEEEKIKKNGDVI